MVTKLRLRDDAVQLLETMQDELPEASSHEDAIETLAWKYARERDHLSVALDGSIRHTPAEA